MLNCARATGKHISAKWARTNAGTTKEHGTQEGGLKQAIERLGRTPEDLPKVGLWEALCRALDAGEPAILLVDETEHWIAAVGRIGKRVIVFDSTREPANKQEHGVQVVTKGQLLKRMGATKYGVSLRKRLT